ncbi:migration and invasion inhibitory protein [Parambassis ranga]|uniref:Migration and invasion inhibitory protein n=1 Tax=Parambassis ranga TaxID=210632 RepID=A0A6P7IIG2_9TELE|nr:migration and invasion-inhibitory protein [Parambassis ranga]
MSTSRQEVLRQRNKDLLNQLQQQSEKLERLCGRKREREAEDERREQREDTVTLTGGDHRPARAALAKPSVRFADTFEEPTDIRQTILKPSLTSKPEEGTVENTTASDFYKDRHRISQVHNRIEDRGPFSAKSCLVNHSKEKRELQSSGVTFQFDECDDEHAPNRHHLQPLLGYDWIAGVLDSEDSLIERSDEFFNDLQVFRSLNKDACVHSAPAEFSEEHHPPVQPLTDKDEPDTHMDTHQCTFSYRINSRLFPVPLHSQECCPQCKRHKSSHPHTAAEPAMIRVSIPRTNLLPPYKYKPHRRCSFDPSDSVGLPSHCLSGWSNTGQNTLPPPSSLDLRSSVNMKKSNGSLDSELEDLSASKMSAEHDKMSEVARLARHNFQHFFPRRKLRTISHPVC